MMSWISTIALGLAFLIFLFVCDAARPTGRPTIFNVKCQRTSKGITNHLDARKLLFNSTLKSRAMPNRRLVLAFGIDNAFTTVDPLRHKAFVNEAKDIIRMQETDWKNLADAAIEIARRLSGEMQASTLISLETSVQLLVFRVILGKFFPDVCPTPPDNDIEYLARNINTLWVASKCSNDQSELDQKRNEFLLIVASIFNCSETSANPLNLILPAYETLWRVVLRCFLEVRFRSSNADRGAWSKLLSHFLSNPTQSNFESRCSLPTSVRDIALEALRLYPPTRRIYRQQDDTLRAVDIESMHRDPANWGARAETFDPSRIKDMKRQAFMPFGKGNFACPAETLFAPMTIAILVAVLVVTFDDQFELVDEEMCVVALGIKPLDNGREAYGWLQLQRK
jgi:hypothetical protein